MAEYPYVYVPGKIKDLFRKIRETGVPAKATNRWLAELGYKSSNDRSLLRAIRVVGLIDVSGTPTERWRQYRGADHGSVLAEGMRLGYADLFSTYPDACSRTANELQHFFSTRTTAGQRAVQYTVQTFKALCELADFGKPARRLVPIDEQEQEEDEGERADDVEPMRRITRTAGRSGLVVNINVQLTIPETTDETVYDRFFAAFKKHLLSGDSD